MRSSQWVIVVVLVLIVPMTFGTQPAQTAGAGPAGLTGAAAGMPAPTITVTTTEDELNTDRDCSLREAVQAANTDTTVDNCRSGRAYDTIILPAGIYTLSIGGNSEDGNAEGDLDVAGVLTILGAGAATTIIQGGTSASNGIDRVFHVLDSSSLTLQDVTVRYGRLVPESGPHINDGGGIYVANDGLLALNHASLTGNEAWNGGGIYLASGGLLNVDDGNLTDNRGMNGGAIATSPGVTVTIHHSTISNNNGFSGGGGIRGLGTANIDNTTFHGNWGSFGAAINKTWEGPLTVTNCTFSDNVATEMNEGYGGAIAGCCEWTITNCTFSGNWAHNEGGAIRSFGTVSIRNSTFAGNTAPTAGGILALRGVVTLTNSIVVGSTGGDCSGTIVSNDHNIDSDDTCNLAQAHDRPHTDPGLDPLADNGGPTWTHALPAGSLAISTGDCSGGTIAEDQRGVARPQGDACDIGSYEYDGAPFVVATDDSYAISEDVSLTVAAPGVLFNDAGFYGLAVTAGTTPTQGTLALNVDGSFAYTPTPNFDGVDGFTYSATDGTLTDTATVSITVAPVNDPPVAIDDIYRTTVGVTLTVVAPGVLGNDYDIEATPPLTAITKTLPWGGTLALNPDGSFTYTPTAGFSGVDQFQYCANDGSTDSASATVTIGVVGDVHWIYLPMAGACPRCRPR